MKRPKYLRPSSFPGSNDTLWVYFKYLSLVTGIPEIPGKFHNELEFNTVYTYLSTMSVKLVSSISLESPFVFRKACMDVTIEYGINHIMVFSISVISTISISRLLTIF